MPSHQAQCPDNAMLPHAREEGDPVLSLISHICHQMMFCRSVLLRFVLPPPSLEKWTRGLHRNCPKIWSRTFFCVFTCSRMWSDHTPSATEQGLRMCRRTRAEGRHNGSATPSNNVTDHLWRKCRYGHRLMDQRGKPEPCTALGQGACPTFKRLRRQAGHQDDDRQRRTHISTILV